MNVVYCVLELTEADVIDVDSVSRITKVARESVTVINLSKCTNGNRKRFAMLADLYIWTCKYWYGTHKEKLTFVELRGIDSLPSLFSMRFSEKIRLAIAANKLSIFDSGEMKILKEASAKSLSNFDERRVEEIALYMPLLEKSFKLLSCPRNPFG